MKLSIIIPAFNEELELPHCLSLLMAIVEQMPSQPFDQHEVIVVDNNSTDATASIAHRYGAIVVFEAVNQIGRARNAGARRATGDWLLFIDADSRPSADTFTRMCSVIDSGRYAGGGSTIAMPDAPLWGRTSVFMWNVVSVLLRYAAGSFIFVLKPVFDEIGGFDEQYFAAEEVYLSRAIKTRARQLDLGFHILRGSPHRSSARKFRLYTLTEMLALLRAALPTWSQTVRSRKRLDYFYDGRREQPTKPVPPNRSVR